MCSIFVTCITVYMYMYEICIFHKIINTIPQKERAFNFKCLFKGKLFFFQGQKFPKSLNANLEATVVFTDAKSPSSFDDPFCTDQNAYAQVKTCILNLPVNFP